MIEALKSKCETLSLSDMMELREHLSGLIAKTAKSGEQSPLRCSILMRVVAEIMGMQTIDYFSRDAESAWARTLVAWQMTREGYKVAEIGRQMMKDHSSVSHMTKKMRDVFAVPTAYKDIVYIWNSFQTKLQDEIQN